MNWIAFTTTVSDTIREQRCRAVRRELLFLQVEFEQNAEVQDAPPTNRQFKV